MTKKRLILGAALFVIIVVTIAAWRIGKPPGKPVFLDTARGRYRLISSRYVHGTNLVFSADSSAEEWGRRQLDRVHIPLQGSRGGSTFSKGIGIHAIALLCEGRVPSEDLMQIDVECITESGQTVRLRDRMTNPGSRDRVCFIFYYADSEIKDLHRYGYADAVVTNFLPRQLRILRASDHRELSLVNLSH